MIYRNFKDKKLSMLGFGTMRLPLKDGGKIDEEHTRRMVDFALENGVNYFDTAYPYHGGMSERIIGKILSEYPRESYYLATKYPGHMISEDYDPAATFEEQLQKCGVSYFDFYLLHNVYENSIKVYRDERWGIVDYFLKQRSIGRIKHLGFSSHGQTDNLRDFLDEYGKEMEFCQIQLNYLDWTMQNAKEKYELLTERNIPVWVMEPVRGGKLTGGEVERKMGLREICPKDSAAAVAFKFIHRLDNVTTVLSGMSNLDQMRENIETFEKPVPLDDNRTQKLLAAAENLKDSLPCTACGYCLGGCPCGLDIPGLIGAYNDFRFDAAFSVTMFVESLPDDKKPSSCIGCGKCSAVCPQKIEIPSVLKEFAEGLSRLPSWAEICRQREAAQAASNKE